MNARWKISASSPAVRMSSASVTLNIGHTHDLHEHFVGLLHAQETIWKELYMHVHALRPCKFCHHLALTDQQPALVANTGHSAMSDMHAPIRFGGTSAKAQACRWEEAAHQMFHGNRTFMSGGFTSTSGSFCMTGACSDNSLPPFCHLNFRFLQCLPQAITMMPASCMRALRMQQVK